MKGPGVATSKPMTVETLLEAGSSGRCEDALLVSGHVYGVFEGGAPAATAAASEVFGSRTSASLVELCEEADRQTGPSNGEGKAGVAYSVLRVERDGFDWVHVGRGELVVVLPDGSFEHLSNAEGAPGVRSGRRKLAGVRHILLFTDGLMAPRPEPGFDLSALVTSFLDGGLAAAFAPLRTAEARDDVAAIAISFLPPNPPRLPRKPKTKRPKRSNTIPPRRKRARPSEV